MQEERRHVDRANAEPGLDPLELARGDARALGLSLDDYFATLLRQLAPGNPNANSEPSAARGLRGAVPPRTGVAKRLKLAQSAFDEAQTHAIAAIDALGGETEALREGLISAEREIANAHQELLGRQAEFGDRLADIAAFARQTETTVAALEQAQLQTRRDAGEAIQELEAQFAAALSEAGAETEAALGRVHERMCAAIEHVRGDVRGAAAKLDRAEAAIHTLATRGHEQISALESRFEPAIHRLGQAHVEAEARLISETSRLENKFDALGAAIEVRFRNATTATQACVDFALGGAIEHADGLAQRQTAAADEIRAALAQGFAQAASGQAALRDDFDQRLRDTDEQGATRHADLERRLATAFGAFQDEAERGFTQLAENAGALRAALSAHEREFDSRMNAATLASTERHGQLEQRLCAALETTRDEARANLSSFAGAVRSNLAREREERLAQHGSVERNLLAQIETLKALTQSDIALAAEDASAALEARAGALAQQISATADHVLDAAVARVEESAQEARRHADALREDAAGWNAQLAARQERALADLAQVTDARLEASDVRLGEALAATSARLETEVAAHAADLRQEGASLAERLAGEISTLRVQSEFQFDDLDQRFNKRLAALADEFGARLSSDSRTTAKLGERLGERISDVEDALQSALLSQVEQARLERVALEAEIAHIGDEARLASEALRADLETRLRHTDSALANTSADAAALRKLLNQHIKDSNERAERAAARVEHELSGRLGALAARLADGEEQIANAHDIARAEIARVEACTLAALESGVAHRAKIEAELARIASEAENARVAGEQGLHAEMDAISLGARAEAEALSRRLDDMRVTLDHEIDRVRVGQRTIDQRLSDQEAASATMASLPSLEDALFRLRAEWQAELPAQRALAARLADVETRLGAASDAANVDDLKVEIDELCAVLAAKDRHAELAMQSLRDSVRKQADLSAETGEQTRTLAELASVLSAQVAASQEAAADALEQVTDHKRAMRTETQVMTSIADAVSALSLRLSETEARQVRAIVDLQAETSRRFAELPAPTETSELAAEFLALRARVEERLGEAEQRTMRSLDQIMATVELIASRFAAATVEENPETASRAR